VYSATDTTPTISDTKVSIGSGVGSFSKSVSGLSPNTTYYVRSYVVNLAGISYGVVSSFTTLVALPTVTTTAATSVALTSATLGGEVTSAGGGTVTDRGVVYSTSNTTPTTSDTKVSIGSGVGIFSQSVTGLGLNTSYYVRSYAVNSAGISYGAAINLKTSLSNDASIHELTIDGDSYTSPSQHINYVLNCGSNQTSVSVAYTTESNASSSKAPTFDIAVPKPGIYRDTIRVKSQDGAHALTYYLAVEKRFSYEDIVVEKFNNVLLVNNNSTDNGGYKFVAYQWYCNDQLVGNDQYYSAGSCASDLLNRTALYQVKMITDKGDTLSTCSFRLTGQFAPGLQVMPNPVIAGSRVRVLTNYSSESLSSREIIVHSLLGTTVYSEKSAENDSYITVPSTLLPGAYILTTRAGGVELNTKIIVQ